MKNAYVESLERDLVLVTRERDALITRNKELTLMLKLSRGRHVQRGDLDMQRDIDQVVNAKTDPRCANTETVRFLGSL